MAYIRSGEVILTSTPTLKPEELSQRFVMDSPDGKEPLVELFGGARLTEPDNA